MKKSTIKKAIQVERTFGMLVKALDELDELLYFEDTILFKETTLQRMIGKTYEDMRIESKFFSAIVKRIREEEE